MTITRCTLPAVFILLAMFVWPFAAALFVLAVVLDYARKYDWSTVDTLAIGTVAIAAVFYIGLRQYFV